ncbi:MAG: hypothetical protein MJZ28_10200 [Paludibacteraceae bacterium]|nr:hypothetical protein [Paludibacteraceae bacterium]
MTKKNAIRVLFNEYMSEKYGESWYALFPADVIEAQYDVFRQGCLAMAGFIQAISDQLSNDQ